MSDINYTVNKYRDRNSIFVTSQVVDIYSGFPSTAFHPGFMASVRAFIK